MSGGPAGDLMHFICKTMLALALVVPAAAAAADFAVPAWAYPTDPPASSAATTPPDDTTLLRLPGSRVAFTKAQVKDLFAAPDWYPDSHPPMPDVVARGRKPRVHACGYCHLPDGQGRPENAPLAGLPAAYIEAQFAAFRSGERRSAWHGRNLPTELMRSSAESATAAEVAEAARYFSSLRMTRRVAVIESASVPGTHVAGWLYVPTEGAAREPLGQRIIEVAVDHARHELRGAGLVPPIAGRSPTYMLRQLLAFRTGARAASSGVPMQPVVARLDVDAMIAIAAYVGSLEP